MATLLEDFAVFEELLAAVNVPFEEIETTQYVAMWIPEVNATLIQHFDKARFCAAIQRRSDELASALRVTISVAQVKVDWDWSKTADEIWKTFEEYVHDIGSVRLDFNLNKATLAEKDLQPCQGNRCIVFRKNTSFRRCLWHMLQSLSDFEKTLWGYTPQTGLAQQLNVVLLDLNGISRGAKVRFLGKDHIPEAQTPFDVLETNIPNSLRLDLASDHLRWDQKWVDALTPVDLFVPKCDRDPTHSNFLCIWDAITSNLALLYLAPRSRINGHEGLACFSTEHHKYDVLLYSKELECGDIKCEQLQTFIELLEFAYTGDRLPDRLRFAQLAIGITLYSDEECVVKANEVISKSARILQIADWNWRSFLEERINKYEEGAKSVEEDLHKACEQIGDVTTKIVDDLSKMVISSIGAIITAFAASSLKKDISVTTFQIILAAYALYLGIVIGCMGFSMQYDRFKTSLSHFDQRRKHHEAILGSYRVEAIVGDTIKQNRCRFYRFWFAGISICTLFFFGMLTLVLYASNLLQP